MDNLEYEKLSYRDENKWIIANRSDCTAVIKEMREVETFIYYFRGLSAGRNLIRCGSCVVSMNIILGSAELTVGSIISCCEAGCLADANTLLRKYRDDMFFYLYTCICNSQEFILHDSPDSRKMLNNIERWISNKLANLNIGEIMREIGNSARIRETVRKYNLKAYFDKIGSRLNDYVHGNGIAYYNKGVSWYYKGEFVECLKTISHDMHFITVAFLMLITMHSPLSIMATEYMDYIDCEMTSPEGSQYLVAPFVEEFLRKNIGLIDSDGIAYLKAKTLMKFE